MNPESKLTESQRQLLGEQQAGELERDEQWLAGRLESARVPDAVRARLMRAISGEVSRGQQTAWRRYRRIMEIAAVLVFGLLVGLFVRLMNPKDTTQIGAKHDPKVLEAQLAVNSYLAIVPTNEVQLHYELKRLDRAVAAPQGQDNPFQAIAAVIESPIAPR
ncbi:MAG: hypothetical protein PHU85_09240 [Phycisphaerae bacterium]|nr:hypothetical protein [Phycisphaerae bacterium]